MIRSDKGERDDRGLAGAEVAGDDSDADGGLGVDSGGIVGIIESFQWVGDGNGEGRGIVVVFHLKRSTLRWDFYSLLWFGRGTRFYSNFG